jgi:hypothetical protein
MRLIPVSQRDRSWNQLKAEWKAIAERTGEDFSTLAATFTTLEPFSNQDGAKSGLYGFYEDEEARAMCQISRMLVSRFPSPVVRVRFVTVSPLYDSGAIDLAGYAQLLVGLFSGVVWLARTALGSQIVQFHLRSPSDAQYFAALQVAAPLSPFARFSFRGAWIECALKQKAPVGEPAAKDSEHDDLGVAS